ncbi:hypothetical protein EDD22DRAFT_849547 [Suillus occidentalis]|nr:hypothetical protein EDD22DRAFT_849547 [Suillus occidentalis]
MNFNVNDNPLLVAPRPVRITPHLARSTHFKLVASQVDHVKLSEDTENIDEYKQPTRIDSSVSSDKDLSSPRASPRSSLPSEALEEFLSICMGWKCPSSPVLRPRRNGAVSLPTFGLPYRSRSRVDFIHAKGDLSSITLTEENEWIPRARSPHTLYERDELENFEIQDFDTQRWNIAHTLSSPISRARNPFLRHPSYDIALSGISNFSQSSPPITSATPMSPAAVPLPVPTPDELVKVY